MYLKTITLLTIFKYINSQQCVPTERSPSNPNPIACNTGFFDLMLDPNNECICCTTTGLPDDNPPDECLNAIIPTENKTEIGTLICNENFDCCSCNALTCNNCVALQCSGDSSCIGVNPIHINGDCDLGGATLQCNGDVSCYRTSVYGECITAINCNGDNSCGSTTMEINLNIEIPDKLRPIFFIFNGDNSVPDSLIKAKNVAGFTCGGDEACARTTIDIECKTLGMDKGCKLEVGGDDAAPNSVWKVNGADFVSCKGDNSCGNSIWQVNCVEKGCPVTFTGDNSAPNTMFSIINANQFSCAGDESCIKSIFDIKCVNNNGIGCPVTITGERAAQLGDWSVLNLNQFRCVGINACINGLFKLNCVEKGCPISCTGSCKDATFNVNNSNGVICNGGIISPTGAIIAGSCENAIFKLENNKNMQINCDGIQSCQNTKFSNSIGGPITNLGFILCTAQKSCFGSDFNISPSSNAFTLSCNGIESCRNSDIDISITHESGIKSLSCNGPNSCTGAFIDVNKLLENELYMESLSCNGINSCQDSIISIFSLNSIQIKNIQCGGMLSCSRLNLNINLTTDIFITTIICGGRQSCVNFHLNIFKNNEIVDDYQINIIGCQVEANCQGAYINDKLFIDI